MHTEELKARMAARYFRSMVARTLKSELITSVDWLNAAEAFTSFNRVYLPADDPLLSGAHALLDREFSTIWINRDRPLLSQYVDAAHEFGHLVMHGVNAGPIDGFVREVVVGYSKNQRDEIDAHRFASEFLLPLDQARQMFLSGKSASVICRDLLLPRKVVLRQLSAAFGNNGDLIDDQASTCFVSDFWQDNAVTGSTPALVFGRSGTGKTAALVRRTRFLIESEGENPSLILAVAESKPSAAHLRRQFLMTGKIQQAMIPVTTAEQLAYDILVRFPESAGLKPAWEEQRNASARHRPDELMTTAVNALKKNPELVEALQERYRHFLVDNAELLPPLSKKLLLALLPSNGRGVWLTSSRRQPVDVLLELFNGSEPSNLNCFPLPYQYRSAPKILDFIQSRSPNEERRSVSRRIVDERSASGSVTIAICDTRDQMSEGIARYIAEKLKRGYRLDNVVVVHNVQTSSDSAWQLELLEKLDTSEFQPTSRHFQELIAVLNLIFGRWNRRSLVTAGTIGIYTTSAIDLLPLRESSDAQRHRALGESGPGLYRLLKDIKVCQRAKTVREALNAFLFEVSDYLRFHPDAGPAAQRLLQQLPATSLEKPLDLVERLEKVKKWCTGGADESGRPTASIDIVSSANFGKRTASIVIYADADLGSLNVMTRKYRGRSGQSWTPSSELLAADAANDHVLYCASSHLTEQLSRLAQKASQSEGAVNTVDWRVLAMHGTKRSELPVLSGLDLSDQILFRQCPRRVYYKRFLNAGTSIPALQEVTSFPATPADSAFCEECRYEDVCPADLS